MTATTELIDDYLDRLDRAARGLPASRRVELLTEIKEHITVALAESPDQGEATVRTLLDRLGAPEDIAREAGGMPMPREPAVRPGVGALEIVAVILLLIGGIVVPVLGWVIGVVLLWASARWTTRDKLLGTLVFPGGLAVLAWYMFFWTQTSTCSPDGQCQTEGMDGGLAMAIVLVGTVGSVATAAYLMHRARRG